MVIAARNVILSFLCGISVGVLLTITLITHFGSHQTYKRDSERTELFLRGGVNVEDCEDYAFGNGAASGNKEVEYSQNFGHNFNNSTPERLNRTTVLCWLLISPDLRKLQAVQSTWGKRCDTLLFMGTKQLQSHDGFVKLDTSTNPTNNAVKAAWQYVYDNHINDADWFLKANEGNYIIVENLKHLCSKVDPAKPYYFGRHITGFGGFCANDAGYVLSQGGLRQFGKFLRDDTQCPIRTPTEDINVGQCLAKLGIVPGDSRDKRKRETFHPFPPSSLVIPASRSKAVWFSMFTKHAIKKGPECCSDFSISFFLIEPDKLYEMEYYAYSLMPPRKQCR